MLNDPLIKPLRFMKANVRVQLSLMMFLQYFIWSSWYVTMSTFLSKSLNCTDVQIGSAYGFTAFAFIISPIFTGLIADKFFDSEKIIGVLHLVGAALLYLMSLSDGFSTFFPLLICYMLLYAPTIALTSSVAMQQSANPDKDFPSIRVLGTIGWIVAGLIIGFGGLDEASSQPFLLAAIASVVLGLYSFALPNTPPKDKNEKVDIKKVFALDAIGMLKKRSFRTLIIAIFLIYIPMTFYFQFGHLFMTELSIERVAAKQTIGQVSEIGFMLALPFFLRKFGLKLILLVGMGAWVLRYVLFGYADGGDNLWMVIGGIALHGICYDFLFISTQIYVDKLAPKNLRSSAQALMATATYGIGMFVGAYAAGLVGQQFSLVNNTHEWKPIWLIAATGVLLILIWFSFFFKDESSPQNNE